MSQSDRISIRPMCFGTYRKTSNSMNCVRCTHTPECVAEEDRLEAQLHAYEAAQAAKKTEVTLKMAGLCASCGKAGSVCPIWEPGKHVSACVEYEGPVCNEGRGPARSKYHREIKPRVFVDVYDVLQAFQVTNPALQHLVKKALAAGQRGHKDRATDMAEIVQSAIRAQELEQ